MAMMQQKEKEELRKKENELVWRRPEERKQEGELRKKGNGLAWRKL
jgi:hypothetical protein